MTDRRNETPTWANVIKAAIERRLDDINISLPARIESFDGVKASVQPLLQRKLVVGGAKITLPIISNVPVLMPATANASVYLPLAKNDTGMLVFSQRSLDKWLVQGGLLTPDDPRKFSISDAQFIPGLKPFSKTTDYDADRLVVRNGDMMITLKDDGKLKISNSSGELLDKISAMVDGLIGEPFVFNKAPLTLLKTLLASMKE